MSATTTMLAGIFFALFSALDERAQKDVQEVLSQISDDPQNSSEESEMFRVLVESVEMQYGEHKSMPPPRDIVDQLIADILGLDKLKVAARAPEAVN
jgi:hypothetical protein